MNNIQTAAYIGMSLNVAMVIFFLITFKGKFKKLYKAYYTSSSWKCITFSSFFKRWFFVTFPFFEVLSPLSDSVLGRSLIRDPRTSRSSTDWFSSVKYYVRYQFKMRFIFGDLKRNIYWCRSIRKLFKQWLHSFLFRY